MAQTVKRLPAMWETRVRFLGQEDPLEKEMGIHSSTLAWKIPWTEEPDRLHSPWGRNESDTTERLHSLIHSLQRVKNPSATQETRVRFLGQEDPLEKKIATHSRVLACKIPRTEEPDRR